MDSKPILSTIKIVYKSTAKKIKLPKSFEELKKLTFTKEFLKISMSRDSNISETSALNFVYTNIFGETLVIKDENDFQKFLNIIFNIDYSSDNLSNSCDMSNSNSFSLNYRRGIRLELKEYPKILSKEDFSGEAMESLKSIVENKLAEMHGMIMSELQKSVKQNLDLYYDNYEKSFIQENSNSSKVSVGNTLNAANSYSNSYCSTQASTIDHRIKCNCCNKNIIGIRYKCSLCEEFNRCEVCDNLDHSHELKFGNEHIFIKVRKPEYLKEIKRKSAIYNLEELSSTCLNHANDLTFTISKDSDARKAIQLQNNGKFAWPKNASLVCVVEGSEIKGNPLVLRNRLGVNQETEFEVVFDITGKSAGKYFSHWQMQTENNISFGALLTFNIEIVENGGEISDGNNNNKKKDKEINSELLKILNVKIHNGK